MKNLQLINLEAVDNIIYPESYDQTTLFSPVTHIFTDFKYVKPLIIEADTLAMDALNLMAKAHVQMKIVVSENNDFLGIISTKELSEQSMVTEVAKGIEREEILVRDMMLSRLTLQAFDLDSLQYANVRDVITSLKSYNMSHCLVVDREHHHIRGVISSSDIARKLHLPIVVNTKMSFKMLFEAISDKI
ncbi:MAG: CBS domain-containing protein [Colwellia sp.]|nr:CBS domain-containing protein [Colwellia sp.]MCW9082083.1 CBS domain-containing protein [Colwellia sp.]